MYNTEQIQDTPTSSSSLEAYDSEMHKILLNVRVCGCKGQEDDDDDDNITISSVK